ncbi:MAG: glycosyltransferase family 39 protein [Planctomycetota bacterium]
MTESPEKTSEAIVVVAQSDKRQWVAVGVGALVVAAVYLYRLDRPLLWGDEADTGILSRNVLRFGVPTAYDGRNLSFFDGGTQLSEGLLSARIPWVQYYLGALSLKVFGDSTQGLRTIFVLIGVTAFLPIFAVLRNRLPHPVIMTVLVLASPQVVLFHRNARYYSILTLLYAILLWHLSHTYQNRKWRFAVATVCLVLLYHTHSAAAVCASLSVLLFCVLKRRPAFLEHLLACGLGCGSWLIWWKALGRTWVPPPPLLAILRDDPAAWLGFCLTGLKVTVLDLDAVTCFPILAWAVVLACGWFKAPGALREALRDPLVTFILISLAVQSFVLASCFGYEAGQKYALLRYMPYLVTFSLVPLFIFMHTLLRHGALLTAACAAVVGVNAFTLSFWTGPSWGDIPVSWWPPVYREILQPPTRAWDGVMDVIRRSAAQPQDEETMLVVPDWMDTTAIFYLGDRFLIIPHVEKGSSAEGRVRRAIGAEAYRRFDRPPKYAVDCFGELAAPPGYRRIEIPSFSVRPDDGARPELTRHAFTRKNPVGVVYLFERLE